MNSFAPGTKVLMADGSTTEIELIELGELVWAVDPETGEAGPRPVTALIEGTGEKDLVTVSTESGSVVATAGHPFWSVSDASWVDAGDLQVGDALLQVEGSLSTVTDVSVESAHARVLNVTVAVVHTYFVIVGDAPTLVHNCGGSAIGFSDDTVGSAFQGMRNEGGHAVRHLREEGLIPNSGSLASQRSQLEAIISPILQRPSVSFPWKLGETPTQAFGGYVNGTPVVAFVARTGEYQGRVLSAVVPSAEQLAKWGL